MPVDLPIYLDNHATTRVDPRVIESMLPYFTQQYGNANSRHAFGQEAAQAVDVAREAIAASIGAMPEEIVFTSGATESNNLAIRGIAEHPRRRGDPLVSVRTEHSAVLQPLEKLQGKGFEVSLLGVAQHGTSEAGRIDLADLESSLRDDTTLVSIMLANNEIGVIQPLAEIAELCGKRGIPLHCDATQAVGKIPVDVNELGIDLMSFTAHKMYGPKGIGALYVRRKRPALRMSPQIVGGGQQSGRRSGTLNVPGIVGFARALELSIEQMEEESTRLTQLRLRLHENLVERLGTEGVMLCGPEYRTKNELKQRLPGNLNLAFPGIDGEALLLEMPNLALSSGAACSSADASPSHVLMALGMKEDAARSTLRFGIGRFNSEEEIDFAAEQVAAAVARLKQLQSSTGS
ncbi:cysteine desulfurase family protein [Adhaeretor mobilis]|uniref:cysteine desulfurase n=1 Tax=Adhaeretor mobilis TaxID=1930276 RepID=A0A517MVS8_9BACT|nr:cysteine desulfurase family protein [Adhaeretor mobilis]QDS98986.1 Cysteine desulfurase [Adhaeretor mobilis]